MIFIGAFNKDLMQIDESIPAMWPGTRPVPSSTPATRCWVCPTKTASWLPLFLDGARLGYGLVSEGTDVTLADLARLTDVFYIGGTKVGALCGEAVVFPHGAPAHFMTMVMKQGALLAKGRLLGYPDGGSDAADRSAVNSIPGFFFGVSPKFLHSLCAGC